MDRIKQTQELDLAIASQYTLGAVYIGNQAAAEDISLLNKFQINAIITVSKNCLLYHPYLNSSNYLHIPAEDIATYQLQEYFNKTWEFINIQRQRTNILVHCLTGVSMSATIILAYLMKQSNMKFIQAYLQLRRKRSKVQPNSGFIFQLYQYENTINTSRGKQDKMRDCISIDTIRNNLTQKPIQNKQDKRQQSPTKKNNKSILLSKKSLTKKKVSFKIIEPENDQIQINNPQQKSTQLQPIKKYPSLKDELKDLKENIDMLRNKLNERNEKEMNMVGNNINTLAYKNRTFYY